MLFQKQVMSVMFSFNLMSNKEIFDWYYYQNYYGLMLDNIASLQQFTSLVLHAFHKHLEFR